MQKINKNQFFIILIILLNIIIITIPYTIKNNDIRKKIKINSAVNSSVKAKKDFYKIYDDFNKILEKLEIKPVSKNTYMTENSLKIELVTTTDIKSSLNILTYLSKDIEDMNIISSDINNDENSEIVFYIEN